MGLQKPSECTKHIGNRRLPAHLGPDQWLAAAATRRACYGAGSTRDPLLASYSPDDEGPSARHNCAARQNVRAEEVAWQAMKAKADYVPSLARTSASPEGARGG